MIRRVFKGASSYGLVKYLYGEGRRNEHTDAHMIASWDGDPAGLEPEFIEARGRHDVSPLVRQLEQPVKACERAPEQYVYHLVFSNDESDRRLSDEEWGQVCRAAMDRTGIAPADDAAGCRWIAVRHADDHVHVVATLAREDARAPSWSRAPGAKSLWRDYAKLGDVAHEFEAKFGLRSTAGRDDNTAAARPGVKEQVTADRAGRTVSPRVSLAQKVRTAAASSGGFGEFTDHLAAAGVTVWPRMSTRNPEEMTGYSVSLNDWTNAAGQPVRFGGGKLAPDLSWPKLRARWEPTTGTPPPPGRASTAPQSESPRPRGPLSDDDAARVWEEAERIVRDAADRIGADAHTDPDAAADAAWAASDTLTGAAAGIEGEHGGPLTDAAAAFERAGRDTYRRTPTRSDTGTALRSAGRMITLLAAGSTHPAAQVAALTTALASLTAAVADLRTAQQRLHQAEDARAAAERLRTVAPIPAATVAAPRRAPNAADIAGRSFKPGPFRVHKTKPSSTPRKDDPAAKRRAGPQHGRGPTQ